MDSGLDRDRDGVLDPDEIDITSYLCDPDDGLETRMEVEDEPAGVNCTYGGTRLTTGLDYNHNGELDDFEVMDVSYLCVEVAGGEPLIHVEEESAGGNCADGGKKIESGIDSDGDGQLDPEEVADTRYVCAAQADPAELVNVVDEPAGENCPNGGVRIETGADSSHNGELESEEVEETRYVCDPDPETIETTTGKCGRVDGMPLFAFLILAGWLCSRRRVRLRS